jgi:hypothetical protein
VTTRIFYGLLVEESEQKRTEGWFVQEVVDRIKNHRNFLCCIVGSPGSGKSYLGIRMCQKISEKLGVPFTVDNILFDPGDFFDLIDKLPSGSFIMIDEAGVALDARKFMTTFHSVFNYVLETFRFKLINMIFVLPDLAMLDANCRRVLTALIRVYDRGYGRVYKLKSSYLGSQWLKGLGVLENVPMPDYEKCKRPNCLKCPKFDECDLLRGQYERKKHEAFETLKVWSKMVLSQPKKAITPYNPFGVKGEDIDKEDFEEKIYGEDVAEDEMI